MKQETKEEKRARLQAMLNAAGLSGIVRIKTEEGVV